MRWFRAGATPAAVLELAHDFELGTVSGFCELGQSRYLVAGTTGLLDSAGVLTDQPAVLAWDLIETASWQPPVLAVQWRNAPGRPVRSTSIVLPDEQTLTPAVRTMVTESVLVQRTLQVGDFGSAQFIARRRPDGEVRWVVRPGSGLDLRESAQRAAADEVLRDLRETLGL